MPSMNHIAVVLHSCGHLCGRAPAPSKAVSPCLPARHIPEAGAKPELLTMKR